MPVVVAVRVVVRDRRVQMTMSVRLGDVQVHRDSEREGAEQRRDAEVAVAERPGDGRTDERTDGEDGAGAASADATLREKLEAKAQAVAGGAAREQREHGEGRWTRLSPDQRERPRCRGTEQCRRPPDSGGIGLELADLGVTSAAFVGNAIGDQIGA